MNQLTAIQLVAIWVLPILFAITLHEAAHGFVAYQCGDDTAYRLGRVSANPIRHIDLIGTIVVPVILLLTTSFVFGWAKPVPVDALKLKHPRRDFVWVALAGPVSNFLMAVIWALLLKMGILMTKGQVAGGIALKLMGQAGITINLLLMVLNLIPIPPLDGSRVLAFLLPAPWDVRFNQAAPLGLMLVMILAVTDILGQFILPPLEMLQRFLLTLFNIHI